MYTKQDTLTKINKKYSRSYIENEKIYHEVIPSPVYILAETRPKLYCVFYHSIHHPAAQQDQRKEDRYDLGTNVNVCS